MEVVPNPHNDDNPALSAGDPVTVHLNSFSTAFLGIVMASGTERLRLKVHGVMEDDADSSEPSPCLNWDVIIPMSSIAWIRHTKGTPVGCKCTGDA